MTEAEALHNAARRYCIERRAELVASDKNVLAWGSQNYELAFGPRMMALREIHIAIERIVPTLLGFEELRETLIETALHTESSTTLSQRWRESGGREKTQIERELLVNYIRNLTLESLTDVQPLPYCRFLTQAESKNLADRLQKRWQIGEDQWIPYCDVALNERIFVVHTTDLQEYVGAAAIQQLLVAHGIHTLLKVCSDDQNPDCELHISSFGIVQYWQHYWTSESLDWVICVSEHGAVTIAGDWLIQEIKSLWHDWEKYPFVLTPYTWPSRTSSVPSEVQKRITKLFFEFYAAIGNEDIEQIDYLLQQGFPVNHQSETGFTILHWAVKHEKLASTQFLIQKVADVNLVTSHGVTPLMEAVLRGSLETVRILIQSGADVSLCAFDHFENGPWAGLSALEIAEQSGYLTILQDGKRRDAIMTLLKATE